MDIHDLWQEHKRWILGVLGGLLAFWIGRLVVGSIWDESKALSRARADVNAISGELYDDKALADLREENARLTAAEQKLIKALAFKVRDEFLLEGKGPADLWYDKKNNETRRNLRRACEDKNVELLDRAYDWAQPTEREDVQGTLVAFDLMDRAVTRLLQAHDQVRKADSEALGLVAIDKLRVDRVKAQTGWRGPKTKLQAEDVVQEDRVEFSLRADVHTLRLFLEACRAVDPPLTLVEPFKMVQGKTPGDPLLVTGKLAALQIKPQEKQ